MSKNQGVKPKSGLKAQEVESETEDQAPEQNLTREFTERNMTGQQEVMTDLFKLLPAEVIKYEGWEDPGIEHPDAHPSKFSHWEHTHPFRTYDRKGSKQTFSTPIGGHFHIVEWKLSDPKDPNSVPKILSVSGPMVMQSKIIRGKKTNVPVPANDFDEHTHDVQYLRSSKMVFSKTNPEAAKVMAYESAKTEPIPGVQVK